MLACELWILSQIDYLYRVLAREIFGTYAFQVGDRGKRFRCLSRDIENETCEGALPVSWMYPPV
jgi:hypothetical protein